MAILYTCLETETKIGKITIFGIATQITVFKDNM